MASLAAVTKAFLDDYGKTPLKLKLIDAFLIYALASASIQLAYLLLVGTFPFNAFLAGFLSSTGFFALTACLRLQLDPGSKDFVGLSPGKAFTDWVLGNLVLHLVVIIYIG